MDKKKKTLVIVVAVVGALLLLVGGFFIIKSLKDDEETPNNNQNVTDKVPNKTETPDDGKEDKPSKPSNPSKPVQKPSEPEEPDEPEEEPIKPVKPVEEVKDDKAYKAALNALTLVSDSFDEDDYKKAETLISALSNEARRLELMTKLLSVREQMDTVSIVNTLKKKVDDALSREDIVSALNYRKNEKVQLRINQITKKDLKDELQSLYNSLSAIIDDNDSPKITGINNNGVSYEEVNLTISDLNNIRVYMTRDGKVISNIYTFLEEGVYTVIAVDDAFNKTEWKFEITAKEASTFEELAACLNDSSIACKLVDDIEFEPVIIENDADTEDDDEVINDFVLNLNEKKLTLEGSITIKDGANLVVNGNGVITSEEVIDPFVVEEGSSLTLEDGNYINNADGGSIISVNANGSGVSVSENAYLTGNYGLVIDSTLSVNASVIDFAGNFSGNIEGEFSGVIVGILSYGDTGDVTINILDTAIINDCNIAIYNLGNATINVNGGDISGEEAIRIENGVLNINGGIITGDVIGDGEINNNVEELSLFSDEVEELPKGSAIMILGGDVTINGGVITSDSGYAVYDNSGATLKINSGEFIGDIYSSKTGFIDSGIFSEEISSTYVNTDSKVTTVEDELYGSVTVIVASRNISVRETENGEVSVSEKSYSGDEVQIAYEADEEYEIDTIKVINKTTLEEIEISEDMTFVMPDDDVEVIVTFKEIVNSSDPEEEEEESGTGEEENTEENTQEGGENSEENDNQEESGSSEETETPEENGSSEGGENPLEEGDSPVEETPVENGENPEIPSESGNE